MSFILTGVITVHILYIQLRNRFGGLQFCEIHLTDSGMFMLLTLSDQLQEPLHGQISRQVRAKILAGRLPDNAPLPSIRSLARDIRVSVITVQRAYEDLEREGLIHVRRGKGFYISPLSSEQKREMARERLHEVLSPLLADAVAQGLNPSQIRKTVDSIITDEVTKQ